MLFFFFDQLSMTLPEQIRDPLLGPNPPVENHSIESSIIETYLVSL